ncbi:MAG: FAD binding domain-containing protein [Spirochaetales bacterium]|nr:FAD binding domain-containing protein [Spirochaetales bacterium]
MVNFYCPETLEEALSVRSDHGAVPLAGGTDLMVRFENWSSLPAGIPGPVMSVGQLEELKYIREEDGQLCIGAALPLNQVLEDQRIPRSLAAALDEIAAPSLRNLATLAGNIQNASPAADSVPPLLIMDARVRLLSSAGSRTVDMGDFITGPGKTVLKEDEIIESVRIPMDFVNKEAAGILSYRKVGTRKANALSKLSVCFWAETEKGVLKDIRLALGAVAATVVRLKEACARPAPLRRSACRRDGPSCR